MKMLYTLPTTKEFFDWLCRHQRILSSGKEAMYYYTKTQSAWVTIPASVQDFITPPLFSASSFTPVRVYAVFFSQERLSGSFTTNIQTYEKPTGLTSCRLTLDSRDLGNFTTPAMNNFDTGELLKHYCSLHMTSGSFYDPSKSLDISYEDFEKHKFIL